MSRLADSGIDPINPPSSTVHQKSNRFANNDESPGKAACHAPFTTLSFHPTGEVLACSRKPAVVVGDVRTQRLRDIFRGGVLAQMRESLAAYKFPTGCEWCEWCVENEVPGSADLQKYKNLPIASRKPLWPRRLEFNLSNICNLECIHCDGELSSAIRARRDRLPPLARSYGEQFFADLDEFLPHLESAVFLGGEPFLQTECFRIWDRLIDLGLKPHCLITTNGTIYNERVDRVLHELPFQLTVSLDGRSKGVVESIRKNARFEDLMQNLDRFHEHARRDGNKLLLSFCMMRQNCHEFADFLLMAEGFDAEVWINTVTDPSSCSPFEMPESELATCLAQLDARASEVEPQLTINGPAWKHGLSLLRSALDKEQRSQARTALDSSRKFAPTNLGWEFLRKQRPQDALDAVRGVGTQTKEYADACIIRAQALRHLDDLDGARAAIADALAWAPAASEDLVAAHLECAIIAHAQNEPGEALSQIHAARSCGSKIESKSEFLFLQLEARSLCLRGDREAAMVVYEKALAAAWETEATRELRLEQAWIRLEIGDWRGALTDCEQLEADEVAACEVCDIQATAHSQAGNFDAAHAVLQHWELLDSGSRKMQINRTLVLDASGDRAAARKVSKALTRAYTEDLEVQMLAAKVAAPSQ